MLTVCRSYLGFYPSSPSKRGKVAASAVAKLMKDYGILCVVPNACDSARSDLGLNANLAGTFVRNGVPLVLGMAYKLLTSALAVFFESFYKSLPVHGHTFQPAARNGRRSMREQNLGKGGFGLEVPLQDWIVPNTYASSDVDLVTKINALFGEIKQKCPIPSIPLHRPCPTIWEQELLNAETRLLDPWDPGSGPVVFIDG